MIFLPERCVAESHLDGIEILVVLCCTDMDRILGGAKLIRSSAIDGDVGAGVVEDSLEPEWERADVPVAAYIKLVWSFPSQSALQPTWKELKSIGCSDFALQPKPSGSMPDKLLGEKIIIEKLNFLRTQPQS